MITTPETWFSVPEAAGALSVAQRDVRNMLANRWILTVRRGETAALTVSSLTLVDEGERAAILPSFCGTLATLSGAGCSDEEVWRWLAAANDELGECPIDTLWTGRVHAVRRATATLVL